MRAVCHTYYFLAPSFDAQEKPNVIVMVMDNLGWGEIGCYGGGILRGAETLRPDQLACEGMRFLNSNVKTQCVPSRSALMTGRHPIRSGTTKELWGQLYGMTQWEITIAELLFERGEQGLNIPLGETRLSGSPTEFEDPGDVQKLEKHRDF